MCRVSIPEVVPASTTSCSALPPARFAYGAGAYTGRTIDEDFPSQTEQPDMRNVPGSNNEAYNTQPCLASRTKVSAHNAKSAQLDILIHSGLPLCRLCRAIRNLLHCKPPDLSYTYHTCTSIDDADQRSMHNVEAPLVRVFAAPLKET